MSLTPDILARDDLAPNLTRLAEEGSVANVRPPFPATTCTSQATLTTGTMPREHGVVANGWFDRERHAIEFWEQPSALVKSPRVWDRLKDRKPNATSAHMFFQQSMHGSADYIMSPRPIHLDDGMVQWVYSKPPGVYESLVPEIGAFDLKDYWGPLASFSGSEWIAKATARVISEKKPTMSFVYFPHLDYNLLRHGPGSPEVEEDIRALDGLVGNFLGDLETRGGLDDCAVGFVGEYAFHNVTQPVFLNRVLREAGLLDVREIGGHEYLDTENSRAFAVVDHEVAHVYCDPDAVDEARGVLKATKGVDLVLDREGQKRYGLDHPRSGELVAAAAEGSWFPYYYWMDDAKAPPFTGTVDIHRKVGFDPVELFYDREKQSIPLDAGLLKGAHGRPADGPRDWTSFVLTGVDDVPFREGDTMDLAQVPETLLDIVAPRVAEARR